EAGPLLVKDGLAAYQPELERFATGQRILDGLTQQAAVGVTADGSTLLVVAETMRASELVPLFLSLGADRAMRLDSGSSTTLVIDGRAVNRSTERRVVSAIVLVPQRAGN
ncbi:MAG: phosphodiester glycosidase family protein, partial [Trueperaceae bacterium]